MRRFACMLVAMIQCPKLRHCTSRRHEWRTRLRTRLVFTLMELARLVLVRSSSNCVQCFITHLTLMLWCRCWQANNINDGCFRRPEKHFADKYLTEDLKGEVCSALILHTLLHGCEACFLLILPALLYGCEACSLSEDLIKRLRHFHNRYARCMCSVNIRHTFRHHITSTSHFHRLNIFDINSYLNNRILHRAGHVARMPMSRAPRELLTGWVNGTRSKIRAFPRSLKIDRHSQGQPEVKQQTHSIHKSPYDWWWKGTSRVNDYNCITGSSG